MLQHVVSRLQQTYFQYSQAAQILGQERKYPATNSAIRLAFLIIVVGWFARIQCMSSAGLGCVRLVEEHNYSFNRVLSSQTFVHVVDVPSGGFSRLETCVATSRIVCTQASRVRSGPVMLANSHTSTLVVSG
jgi:hypothetical protein